MRFSAAARVAAAESGIIRVFQPFAGLRDRSLVAKMGRQAIRCRILAVGGVMPKSEEDVGMCWEELLGSLWI